MIHRELSEEGTSSAYAADADRPSDQTFTPRGEMKLPEGRMSLKCESEMGTTVRFVWFWTFWHWGNEGFRSGVCSQPPLSNIARLWNEWFQYEASAEDREAIEEVDVDAATQKEFVEWFLSGWSPRAIPKNNQLIQGFILRELATTAPFNRWPALAGHELLREVGGVSAIVLEDTSVGRASDVRPVEATLLPPEPLAQKGRIAAVDFKADLSELNAARQAVIKTVAGAGTVRFLSWYVVTGPRQYPLWLTAVLRVSWFSVAGLIAFLRFGPDPGSALNILAAALLTLWVVLTLAAALSVGRQIISARRAGQKLAHHIGEDEILLRMPGGLQLKGGSAGFAFCLSILDAINRAYPDAASGSWLWQRFFDRLREKAPSLAATGIVGDDGQIKPVEIGAKLQACFENPRIETILSPRQREASQGALRKLLPSAVPKMGANPASEANGKSRSRRLLLMTCRTLTDAVIKIGRFTSGAQTATNLLALLCSVTMLIALKDVWCILVPPAPPIAVAPSSPSPYFLWVSLDTPHPEFFQVALESPMWANRHALVARYNTPPASIRAEIRLIRIRSPNTPVLDQGTVWIERRPYFLGRGFESGERVGMYTVSYINRLGYE
jgi:hypothetical protein